MKSITYKKASKKHENLSAELKKVLNTPFKACKIHSHRHAEQLKKPAPTTQQEAKQQDWHRADIEAALEKAGCTLRKLAIARGYCPGALRNPLNVPWPKGERIIADALGTTPQTIWPSRYHEDGTSKSGRNERDIGVYKRKSTTLVSVNNAEVGGEF